MSCGINNFQGWNLFKNLMSQTSSGSEVNRDDFQKIMSSADTNGDGIVTEDEFVSSFSAHKPTSDEDIDYSTMFKSLSALDTDLSSLSYDEVSNLMQQLGLDSMNSKIAHSESDILPKISNSDLKSVLATGLFDMASSLQNLKSNLTPAEETVDSDSENIADVGSSSSSSNVEGSGEPISNLQNQQQTSNPLETVTKSYDNMSLEELNTEKMSQQTSVNSARNDLTQLYTSNGKIDEAKSAYDEAVANDEQISDELKQQSSENLDAIEEKDTAIGELKSGICSLDGDIASAQSQINSLNADISAYQSAVSTLSSQQSDDPEIQAEIAGQLQAAQASLADAEAQKQSVENQLAQLNVKKADLTEQLGTAETELGELQNQRAEIEQAISENCGKETKEAMQKYNEARNQFQTDVQNAEADLKTMQAELDKINSAIDTKRAEQIKNDNTVSTIGDLFFDGDIKSEYVEKDGIMPYGLISPENIDPDTDYPVLVMLHGFGEVNKGQAYFMQNGVMKAVTESELANFNGYIICPHLAGDYNTVDWDNQNSEAQIRELISDFSSTHNVDTNNIALAGHSWGGKGALYMAKEMDDVFTKALIMSPYDPNGIEESEIDIPIRVYVGCGSIEAIPRNYIYTQLAPAVGEENVFYLTSEHGGVPSEVFNTDTNGNGCPDAYEWLFG